MSESDRQKWDARYARRQAADTRPSALLEMALARYSRERGRSRGLTALDLACGSGRNSLWLARQGFQVDAVDISAEALALGARSWARSDRARRGSIRWLQADLDDGLPRATWGGGYGVITVIRFIDLPLLRQLPALLKPGGMLVVELHLNLPGAPARGALSGPGNPAYLAPPGALAEATVGLETRQLEEGLFPAGPGRQEALARFVGLRPAVD